jgi:hypothetical protein
MEPRLGCDGLAGFQIARDRAGVSNDEHGGGGKSKA